MLLRGAKGTLCALVIPVLFLIAASQAIAWDQKYNYPIKVKVSEGRASDLRVAGARYGDEDGSPEWNRAAGASRTPVLCPRSGFDFEIGMRPFFSNVSGPVRAESAGGEGTYLLLRGHLRVPSENTLWELYANLRMWDKVTARMEYVPWHWSGPGHAGADGNFAGTLIKAQDSIFSDLNITTFRFGADYDVAFGQDLVFGPNADLHIIKWMQRVENREEDGGSSDFNQTILEPSMGAHVRYEPSNTGYFSWFKPRIEARFDWMSFAGLGLSTWDLGAGVAPPVSRNVDAGLKMGYKQWKLEGQRGRLSTDVGVEGLYLEFSLRL